MAKQNPNRPPRVSRAAVPFPDISPVQQEQLAKWVEATGKKLPELIALFESEARKNPDDKYAVNQALHWKGVLTATKNIAYQIRTIGRGGRAKYLDKGE